ncbi:UbiA prenyltransferase domain-containing protein, putative [Perkinsus marinus ATCC 50983]|uniref:UbiA prenyltransferase domain-containing protein, putative n=1 Tax=Perkinsus marinus (strain ATCC 50983 / TXsc) TaxID=423536 RepID=C5KVU4_PERM5|nr:UbiA prenyltransferase domain-containing protein, putative [Perkinsus marinus ATCC 50983]EER11399.1 UbiA prenyltransferase domain-containing protein, putative [Perkinsus marinus ATCC 50983]|eukprot:XP_002779604.1 UbiA prenyltransferase domain-containing protein, putative [Perkinsus marinus ATCC 50983]
MLPIQVVSLRVPPFAALIAPVTISIITMELFGAPVISAERATTAVLALLLLQAAANQINSVADFFNGVDDIHTASDRSLVDGILTPKAMVWSAVALTGLSGALLLVNIPEIESSYRGYVTLSWIAQASFAILYTSGPFPLKYYAMGDLVILLAFGPSVSALMALWASDPTRSLPVLPGVFAFTLPSILVTIGVLNANNIRDLDSDAAVGIYTVANILGHRWCRIYFGVLQLLPHIISLWLAVCLPLLRYPIFSRCYSEIPIYYITYLPEPSE